MGARAGFTVTGRKYDECVSRRDQVDIFTGDANRGEVLAIIVKENGFLVHTQGGEYKDFWVPWGVFDDAQIHMRKDLG